MKFLIFIFLSMLLFSVQAQEASDFSTINQNIAHEYPMFRRLGASYSIIFGGMAIWQGTGILGKDKPDQDQILATATVAVGSIRFVDGAFSFFRQAEAERMANNNEIQDRATLKRLARESRFIRVLRSSLIAANSALFLSLYAKGDDDYRLLVIPGTIMGAISILNLFRLTPEEKARKNLELSMSMVPVKNGGALVFNFQF